MRLYLRRVRELVLAGATLLDGTVADVRLRDGMIGEVGSIEPQPDDERLDLTGHLLSPAAVEPHAHLDKAFLAERVVNETGDLLGAIDAMVAYRPFRSVPETIERAERAARLLAGNGYSAVRSHADTTTDHGLRSIEALIEVRRRVAELLDVQIVALCGWPTAGPPGTEQRALLIDALAMGADVVGGCPHLDPGGTRPATEVLLQIAADHGLPVDLHTDETLQEDVDGLAELAELVMTTGFPHPVTASHCVSLGVKSPARQREVAEAVAAAGIAVVALPGTNLILQGRGHLQAMPRGVTAVDALRAAGVVVAGGADNLQDPFNPLGRGDPFDTAALMMMAVHLRPADAWASVTDDSRRALGWSPTSVAVGQPADLLAVPAVNVREAIAFAPHDRIVIRRGEVVERAVALMR
ncbi:amidohydrolase family protein [soil metagenome]